MDSTPQVKQSMLHTLVFEPLSGGHRSEFIHHLRAAIERENRSDRRYTLVLAKGLLTEKLPKEVHLLELSEEESQALKHASGIRGTFIFLRLLRHYVKRVHPDRLLVMELTQLELPLCFWRPPCLFRGILFVQYPELRFDEGGWRKHFRQRLRFFWKEFKTGLFLRRTHPERIFLLNGERSCTYLNQRFSTSCYQALPDPIWECPADLQVSMRKEYQIAPERRLFLFFGSMSPRKGVERLISALLKIDPETCRKSAFFFCGKPEEDYAVRYQALIQEVHKKRPEVCLIVEEAFVSAGRMRALFEQADWILMPYSRPEYSSGILGYAVAARTPVMVSDDGLIARQVRAYALGRTVKKSDWTNAFVQAVHSPYKMDEAICEKFVEEHSPHRFAALLLE